MVFLAYPISKTIFDYREFNIKAFRLFISIFFAIVQGSKNGYHNLPQSTVNSNGRIPNGHIDTIHANGKSQPYSSNKYSKVTTPLLSGKP